MTEDIERPVSPRKVSESQLGEVPDEALHGVLQLESMTPRTLESFRKAERLTREPRLAGGRDGGGRHALRCYRTVVTAERKHAGAIYLFIVMLFS